MSYLIPSISRLEDELKTARELADIAASIGDNATVDECENDIENITTEIELIVFGNMKANYA